MPLDFDALRPPSPFMNDSHTAWRDSLRKFVERELMPYVNEWDEAGLVGTKLADLIAFLLSIDSATQEVAVPTDPASGGSFDDCLSLSSTRPLRRPGPRRAVAVPDASWDTLRNG